MKIEASWRSVDEAIVHRRAAHSPAASAGHVTSIVVAPRRSSMRMSHEDGAGVGSGSAMKAGDGAEDAATAADRFGAVRGSECASTSRTQRRSRFALIPRDIATAAIDMPGCMQSSATCP